MNNRRTLMMTVTMWEVHMWQMVMNVPSMSMVVTSATQMPEADADRAQPSIPPVDYQMFYPLSSQPIKIEDCAWAVNEQRLINIPSTIAMNNVPEHKRFKISMVVKDKDLSLLNATVTDTVVPTRQKVIHINCFAHAMMHLDKCAPGCLDQRECLRFALMWLKRIDEGNKVCVCVVCLASCLTLHSPRT